MHKLVHGGDIYSKREIPKNRRLIDFSANINPLGMPLSVKTAIIDNIDNFSCYPDPLSRELIKEISEYEKVRQEYIVCGNGADDIIYRISAALTPKRALLTAPAFSEYEQSLKNTDCSIMYHYLLESMAFKLDRSILDSIAPDIDIMFLCNPNNPTGITVQKDLVLEIAAVCRSNNVVLVVDECFIDFIENKDQYSIVDKIKGFDNVIILKAFTKIYAMAGIRLGYAICSDKAMIKKIYNAGQPWSVSVIAQKCGVAAIKETKYVERTRQIIKQNREYLISELKLIGLKVFDSMANYIFFKSENRFLHQELEKYGILIRPCGNYRGLDDTYFRIAVKSKQDNEYLIESMKEIFNR